MNLRTKLYLARSHFIFIAALLVGVTLILKLEAASDDGWGQNRANALTRLVYGETGNMSVRIGDIHDEADAQRLCALAKERGYPCRIIIEGR